MKLLRSLGLTFTIAALACSCGGKKKKSNVGSKALSSAEIAAAKAYKHPLAEAYYKENPDFFVFSKPEDLPADLVWENGADLPEVGSPKAKKGGTMNIALTDFPRTLRTRGPDTNGHMRSYLSDYVRIDLAHRHPDVEGWFPGIATDWSIDREKAIVYFKLNPKATYSDGVPITVDDFFFTFYFMRSPWIRAPYAAEFFSVYHSKLEKFDDHTFSISLVKPRPDLENYTLGMLPTPRHFYKDFGEDFVERYQWLAQPNSGCYVIGGDDLKKGRSITLRRIENFWAKDLKHMRYRWNPDKLVIKAIRDPNKAFETFKKGDRDMARLNLAKYWYEQLPNDDPLVANGYISKSTFFQDVPQSGYRLWLNTSKPLLDDINVRLGLHHATNYELAIDRFFRNDWIREQTTSDGYGDVSHPTIRSRKFSIPKAEEYFAKAGFTERGPDGIFVNSAGKRLSFTVSTGYKTMADLLTILRQEAKKAGVEYNIEILDGTAGWKKSQEKKHDITLSGFAGSPDELYPRYWDFFHSDNAYNEDGTAKANTNNLCCFGLPELDPIIDEYRTAKKHEDKVRLAHQIEEIVHEHGPFVPGAYPPSYRVGSWRWLQWPDGFNVNRSKIEQHWMLHWIDEDMKKETLEAMKSGKTFPPSVKDYDKFKPKF